MIRATTGGNKGKGRLTSATGDTGSSALSWDAQGRLVGDVETVQARTYTVAYAYDANGSVTKVTYPSGRVVNFTNGGDGTADKITTQPSATGTVSTVVSSVQNLPFRGRLKSLTYGNGLALFRSFDLNQWLTRTKLSVTGLTVLDLDFGRDADGRLNLVNDRIGTGRGGAYTYADDGRLVSAAGPWGGESYQYDFSGNRIQRAVGSTVENVVPAAASNRITAVTDGATPPATLRTFSYRTGGDLLSDAHAGGATYTYVYNARKRLKEMDVGATSVATYGYDPFGRRVWRSIVGGASTHYVFDQDGRLLAEHDASTGAVVKEYIWLRDEPVAMIDSSSGTAQTYYITTGQIGEPLVMTDASKAKVWDAMINPYGTASMLATPTANLDLRLPGQWVQLEADGLHQNGLRDYDPTLGRYAEGDPLGIDAGPNVYSYVDGRPTVFSDPWGLAQHSPDSERCIALKQKILNLQNDLKSRWDMLDSNPQGLPLRIGPGEALAQTVRGHRTLINQRDRFLRDAQKKYDDECGPPPPPINCPNPRPTRQPSAPPSISPYTWAAAAALSALLGAALLAAQTE